MDWTALFLSLRLGFWTVAILLPLSIWLGRLLAWRRFRGKALVEALVTLPLVLPPTVLGFYLLTGMGDSGVLGRVWIWAFDRPLAFSFEGLLVASALANIPFAVQPAQRAFEAIAPELREAAACCGMAPLRRLWAVELPLAWPGVLTAMVLTFTHTLGEFGVVLMVGGAIPGETRTIAIAIYDRVQAFDEGAAATMSLALLGFSTTAVALSLAMSRRVGRRLG